MDRLYVDASADRGDVLYCPGDRTHIKLINRSGFKDVGAYHPQGLAPEDRTAHFVSLRSARAARPVTCVVPLPQPTLPVHHVGCEGPATRVVESGAAVSHVARGGAGSNQFFFHPHRLPTPTFSTPRHLPTIHIHSHPPTPTPMSPRTSSTHAQAVPRRGVDRRDGAAGVRLLLAAAAVGHGHAAAATAEGHAHVGA